MELYYNGVDISEQVDIAKCVHHETSGGRCDCLEIEMEDAGAWYAWEPQADDTIIAALNGYQTGKLYLNTILPMGGKFRLLATSTPGAARRKGYASYIDVSLGELMASCASECGMNSALFGLDEEIRYPFLLRKMEGAAAFVDRLMRWEGAAFKAVGGRFAGISIAAIQDRAAAQTIELGADTPGVTHIKRSDSKWAGLTVRTPYAECSAVDDGASGGVYIRTSDLPALDEAQAGRWARGLLLTHNRRAETLTIASEFNAGLSAMARVDIESATEMGGAWIVDEVEHDLVGGATTATLVRCIYGIR